MAADSDSMGSFIQRLTQALGPKGVSTDAHEIEPLVKDWRGRWVGSTPVLVKPSTTEDVSAALKLAAEYRLPVTPQGGNSGMVNGSIPYGEVLISLRRMNRVREVDVLNDAMTLEAGVILTKAQEVADENGRLFPLSLGAEGVATIGGLVSTNAGGVAVLRYGMMREMVLGIEAVLPDGRVWNGLRGLRKDNTGYDLKQLFIGAEGTLGIVTAATLKMFPKPAAKETAWVAVESPAQAVELLARAKAASGGAVTGFEIVSALALSLVLKHVPDTRDPLPSPTMNGQTKWFVLLELSLPRPEGARDMMESILGEAAEAGLIVDAAMADSLGQAAAMWKLRESISIAERAHGKALKHDVAVPVSKVAQFLADGAQLVEKVAPGAELIAFGHVGDGNIHFNVTPPRDVANGPKEESWLEGEGPRITEAVHGLVVSFNGSISAEHGIGKLKRAELAEWKAGIEIEMMRAVKRALDPDGRMNPGRVV